MKSRTIHQIKTSREKPKSLTAFAALLGLAAASFASPLLLAQKSHTTDAPASSSKVLKGLPIQGMAEDEAILHALDRLGYGPRPGDVERMKQMGLAKWIDQQLHPESINDSALEARLEKYPTLTMSASKLLDKFPQPQLAAKREGVSVEEYRKQQQEKMREAAQAGAQQNGDDQGKMQLDELDARLNGNPAAANGGIQPQQGANNPMFDYQHLQTPARIVAELSMAKETRAIYSERQLYEQMVDFWYNHFNVFAGKGADRWFITTYERAAIRPHAMGKFRDLLEATAKSPAMLFYLDNWLSADPVAFAHMKQELEQRRQRFIRMYGGPLGPPVFMPVPQNPNAKKAQQQQDRGLNENYGRELMELHTLGVDGGYTQQDVIEVAKCFTGWTIRQPRKDPEFFFDDRIHDSSTKTVLGHQIHAGGMKDGEEVLDILSRDPHTAQHISFQIAQHFVSDAPPDALVARMAQTFQESDGDIRAVLHTMIYSPEFWSKDTYRAKIKTPFELVVSAARAVGADASVPLMLVQWTNRIGEPLYQCQPPTGYSDKAETWVNTGALLNRMNFALALTANRLRGVQVDVPGLFGDQAAGDPHAALDRAINLLLAGQVSSQTRDTLEKRLDDPQIVQAELDDPVRQVNEAMIAGLVLGSPEFQRR